MTVIIPSPINVGSVGGAAYALGATVAASGTPIAFPTNQSATVAGTVSLGGVGTVTGALNVASVGGAAFALGSTVSANSAPVVVASDQAPIKMLDTPTTSGGYSTSSTIVGASTTAVSVKGSAGQLYHIEAFNNSTVPAFIKFYDAVAPTAGSGTPTKRYMVPASSGFAIDYNAGVPFATAIAWIMTTGLADNDTVAPAAATYMVSVDYK